MSGNAASDTPLSAHPDDMTMTEMNHQTCRSWVNKIVDWTSREQDTNVNDLKNGILGNDTSPSVGAWKYAANNKGNAEQRATAFPKRRGFFFYLFYSSR